MDGRPAGIYSGPCPHCGLTVGILVAGEELAFFHFSRLSPGNITESVLFLEESDLVAVNHDCRNEEPTT